jgi:hypothetical protein
VNIDAFNLSLNDHVGGFDTFRTSPDETAGDRSAANSFGLRRVESMDHASNDLRVMVLEIRNNIVPKRKARVTREYLRW